MGLYKLIGKDGDNGVIVQRQIAWECGYNGFQTKNDCLSSRSREGGGSFVTIPQVLLIPQLLPMIYLVRKPQESLCLQTPLK